VDLEVSRQSVDGDPGLLGVDQIADLCDREATLSSAPGRRSGRSCEESFSSASSLVTSDERLVQRVQAALDLVRLLSGHLHCHCIYHNVLVARATF
jgi:hypothetical protein